MKKALSLIGLLLLTLVISVNKPSSTTALPLSPAPRVNWMSFDKVASFMKEEPRKVYIDMYTSTCHWCKIMDKKTLGNPNVVKYLNENFYCIKFNAESKQDIDFNGVTYHYDKKRRVHELAVELMKGKLSFPTSIFFEENFKKGQPVPGYLKVSHMEMILKYMAENKNKTTPWSKYQSKFKGKWR
jgi:thioredoxin-related protein